jgi:beta-phosphoglucomutase
MSLPTFIFDLDGVIASTEKFHYSAWRETCLSFGYDLTAEKNDYLKGISRTASLKLILGWSNTEISNEKFEEVLRDKNELYLNLLMNLNSDDIILGVDTFIITAKEKNHKIALCSSSKNAKFILDGNDVEKSKPNPEGFSLAAKLSNTNSENCVVFEDSEAGVSAANQIDMYTVGIGTSEKLNIANRVCENFKEIRLKDFKI